jgi:GT2 family glycosyltransferase
MRNDQGRVSVVISTKDRLDDLRRCLGSILRQSAPPHELIIVDAGEIPVPELFFGPFNKILDIHYISAKVGLTQARNIGIHESRGDLILFLDDDTELEPDYMENLIAVFSCDRDHRIGGVSGKIIDPQEVEKPPFFLKIKRSGRNILGRLFFLPCENEGNFQPAGFPTFPPGSAQECMHVECLFGANMAFRREVVVKYPFDETLDGYCFMEDDDIAYRVSREYVNIFTPHARVMHFESPVSRDREFSRKKMLVKNYQYLFQKNIPYTVTRAVAFWWSLIGLFLIEILVRNPEGIKGLFAGIKEIKRDP